MKTERIFKYQKENNKLLLNRLTAGIYYIQKLNQELKKRELNDLEKEFSVKVSRKYGDAKLSYYKVGCKNTNSEIVELIKFFDNRAIYIIDILKQRNLNPKEIKKLKKAEKIYNNGDIRC